MKAYLVVIVGKGHCTGMVSASLVTARDGDGAYDAGLAFAERELRAGPHTHTVVNIPRSEIDRLHRECR